MFACKFIGANALWTNEHNLRHNMTHVVRHSCQATANRKWREHDIYNEIYNTRMISGEISCVTRVRLLLLCLLQEE